MTRADRNRNVDGDPATPDNLPYEVIQKTCTDVWSSKDLTVISALQKINTQLFSDIEDLKIPVMFIAMGHKYTLAERC